MLFSTLINDAEFLNKNPRLFSDIEDAIMEQTPGEGYGEHLKIKEVLDGLSEKGGQLQTELADFVTELKELADKYGVEYNKKIKNG